MNQKLHDSGERREFSSGAVRDRGDLKPRPDLISPHAQMREGMIHTLGSQKYSVRNWEKGMPISTCLASCQRHIEAWKLGLMNEDHIAQARWNLGAIIHFEEEIKAGRMDPVFADMPHYAKSKPRIHMWINPETGQEEAFFNGTPIVYDSTLDDPASPEGDESVVHIASVKELKTRVAEGELLSDRENAVLLAADCGRSHPYVAHTMAGPISCLCDACKAAVEPPTFYVCGPMTGMPDFNFPLFDQVTELARSQGLSVISPAELDREHGIDPSVDPDSVERARRADPNLIQTIVQRDTQVIVGLERDKGDGLILLPGWEKSTGGRAEIALALWMGLKFKLAINTWHDQDCELDIMDTHSNWIKAHLFYQKYNEGIANG